MSTQATAVVDEAVMSRVGRFTDRDAFTATGWCSIERTLAVIGTRSAMVLLREAFMGGRRFDDLARRTGLSDAVAAQRLKQLVADGVMAQVPYQEPGARTRYEYVLTSRGRELFPVIVALMQWGDGLDVKPGGLELVHADCGATLGPVVACAAGHEVTVDQTEVRLNRKAAR
jgi:DNA-binding HxlR family transcriptional regulator